ncbi:MAG: OLD family endonuclease [Gammaproteobacteria bacterium 28-57-27]|nr:MAG: OLD family endonuclease [Gammaproteobacteria bacterium 28-57-27]
MPVYIDKITITNYRSASAAELFLSPYTPLVGYNNSGKSNAISAIQWLLRKSVLPSTDFNDPTRAVEVTGHVTGITQAEIDSMPVRQQQQIAPYIENGCLTIKRTQANPSARATEITLSVLNHRTNTWVPNPTGIDNALGVLLPEPIRIGAMEDAAEDAAKAKTSTTIGKLLAEFIAPVRAAHQAELSGLLYEVERRLSADGDNRFAELVTIENAISNKINDLFPGIGARLHFPVPGIDDLIKSGTLKLHEGIGNVRDFSSYGHGTQRSVQMALIRHLAEVRRGEAPTLGTTLLLIDEPELYLHPFAIEQVRAALKSLSVNGYQVIFSTHSAQMVSATDAQHALLMRKEPARGTYARRRLRDAIQVVVPDSVHQMEQLFTLGNSSQVLFADRVVLTEGKTELRLMPSIFQIIRARTLGQERSALVAQSGVNDTKKSMEILQAMDVPCKAIVDLDYALTGGVTHGFINANDPNVLSLKQILQRLENVGAITLNAATGLPKNGVVRASEAFALLAAEPDATDPINNIHENFRAQNIWLWKRGAIETHLGINGKNEREWARFQTQLETLGLRSICPDHNAIEEMVNWIAA